MSYNAFDVIIRTLKQFPQYIPMLQRTARFEFPQNPQEWLPKEYSTDEIEWIKEYFHLPFQHVAIDDPASCVLLLDDQPNVTGLDVVRKFVDCIPLNTECSKFREGGLGNLASILSISENCSILTVGYIKLNIESELRFLAEGYCDYVMLVKSTTGEIVNQASGDELSKFDASAHGSSLTNASVALQEVIQLNRPNRFILENTPVKAMKSLNKKNKKNTRVLMSFERPTYLLLTPEEIRSRTNMSTTQGVKVSHERRRHTRTFRSEKYKTARGKTIVIPATWVGESEKVIGNRHYKVLLNK